MLLHKHYHNKFYSNIKKNNVTILVKNHYYLRTNAIKVNLADKGDDSYDEEDFENNDQKFKEQIKSLNRLYYMDGTLSGTELKDLIKGTFKRLYEIKLEVRSTSIYLIVYPKLRTDEYQYDRELDTLANILTEWNMKQFIIREFKNIKKPMKDHIEILLKVEYCP